MSKYKKDYLALQNAWYTLVLKYIGSNNNERTGIIDDFRDSLVDEKPEGVKALRSSYEKWELGYWIPFCENKLMEWMKQYPFESQIHDNTMQELQNIRQDYNYLRYRKIMQIIQDSGIGLGQGRDIKTVDRHGYQDDNG